MTYDFQRFLDAQTRDFQRACAELRAGAKRTHWIWYIFPQLADLGRSPTAKHYGLGSLEEARAYLAHPVLGPRLFKACEAAMASGVRDPQALLGRPDDLKVRSCLTLFLAADPAAEVLWDALDQFYDGVPDRLTLKCLGLGALGERPQH